MYVELAVPACGVLHARLLRAGAGAVPRRGHDPQQHLAAPSATVRLSPQRADPHHIAEHADHVLVRLVDLAEPDPWNHFSESLPPIFC
eukprot:2799033-Alexandrium_andersonii.AAC.1